MNLHLFKLDFRQLQTYSWKQAPYVWSMIVNEIMTDLIFFF